MGRKSIEAEGMNVDSLEKVCMSLNLDEDKCELVREAAESICTAKGPKRGKRAPSEYNIFVGKCVKEEKGPVPERFKRCVVKWKAQKK